MSYWGYHLALDCGKCASNTIRDKMIIDIFTRNLVRKIDMVPFGNPQIQHFGSGNKAGYTLVQLIETSNICAHFVEETNDMYLDVFSCKTFSPDVVKNVVRMYFKPAYIRAHYFERQAPRENGLSTSIPELK